MSGLRCGDPLDVKIKRPPKARFIRSKVRPDALFGSGPSRPRSWGVWVNENRKNGRGSECGKQPCAISPHRCSSFALLSLPVTLRH